MKIYFIGIGGIGVSALAQYYLQKGDEVFGSDAYGSEITEMIEKMGAKISVGTQKTENINSHYDLVIYSPSVQENNPELLEARRQNIKCMSYPGALGELSKDHYTIAVSGTHGKSTVTSMIALILIKAGLDPTVIVGTKLKEFNNSNFRMGQSQYLVIEACEHEASFLNYWPRIAVITNIEEDHLDYYENLANIQKAFNEFASHVPRNGFIVKNKSADIKADAKIIDFSIETNNKEAREIKAILKMPGEHNVLNGLAALSVAKLLDVSEATSLAALSDYYGSWRRFNIFELPDFILIDDYAHHPTEIRATLKSAREKYPDKKILCVFQPHQYQRTQFLWDNFIDVFKRSITEKWVDKLILIDVYDVIGREGGDKEKYNSQIMSEMIGSGCEYVKKENEIEGYFLNSDIVIMMGAGSIYNLSQEIKSKHLSTCVD
ncbi:MAG: Mur ligase family protein [Candidatus Paceibacterota bacterium]